MKAVPVLILLALAGCASAPRALPTDQEYQSMARNWVAVNQCASSGQIPLETAAAGRVYMTESAKSRNFDQGRMSEEVSRLGNPQVPVEYCQALALQILESKEKRASSQAAATAPAQTYMPKISTCNRTFGQVNCTTY